ncbi:MAG TPA: class I SAM-dependent methyltransferase [Acidimicrobiales bacterium]|nr:class I SAM-dependent methyltransferase [Acidimicrobiales bacterium]
MLSVDYDRLGLRAGELLLDLGCGGGRHAYEALRRGARVTALDASETELKDVATLITEMEKDEADAGGQSLGTGAVVCADALAIPFRDGSFDRVIAAEVLEHVPGDQAAMGELARVLRPGGSLAVTVPRFGPEAVNWALSDGYHSVEGGHIRIYRRSSLVRRLSRAGLRLRASHHAHALHSPYWWLRCAVGVDHDEHPLVRAYHRLLVWDIVRAPLLTRVIDRALNPLLGKSLVVYVDRPS